MREVATVLLLASSDGLLRFLVEMWLNFCQSCHLFYLASLQRISFTTLLLLDLNISKVTHLDTLVTSAPIELLYQSLLASSQAYQPFIHALTSWILGYPLAQVNFVEVVRLIF